ncbi:MAG TPA: AAA family ATPase [Candidatus Saccharimonadales bacterium]
MPLFLVTGLPGTGKSTVCTELKKRGYEAYDGDYDHLAKWYDADGQPIDESRERDRSMAFLQTHSRDIAYEVVKQLAAGATSKAVFLCADPENEDELVSLFEKVFALLVNEDERQKRLTTRTNNNWGKLPHEIEYDLGVKPVALERYRKYSYVILDASQPTHLVVDQILAQI